MRQPWWLRWFGVNLFIAMGLPSSVLMWMPWQFCRDLGKAAGMMALGFLSLAGLNVWEHFQREWEHQAQNAQPQVSAVSVVDSVNSDHKSSSATPQVKAVRVDPGWKTADHQRDRAI